VLVCCVLIQTIHHPKNIIPAREDKRPSPAIQDISKNAESIGAYREEAPSFALDSQTTKNSFDSIKDFFINKFPVYGYIITSVLHGIAGLTSINNFLFSHKLKKLFDKITVSASKAVTSITYAFLALDSFKKNRMFDFIARLLDPLFVPWMKLEDIHLARGMSAGLTLIDFSQMRKLPNKPLSKFENFFGNLKATVQMLEESFKSGFGADRKLFVKAENDQGHTMALFGHMIMLGSMLGVFFGANQRNLMNKIGGVIRNLGGFLGDITMILHGDESFVLSGCFYAANAVVDALQRFLPANIIDPINHFNMILNNVATYHYGKISRKRNENKFNDSFAAKKPSEIGLEPRLKPLAMAN
jgi:hypothetical protein